MSFTILRKILPYFRHRMVCPDSEHGRQTHGYKYTPGSLVLFLAFPPVPELKSSIAVILLYLVPDRMSVELDLLHRRYI